MFVIRTEKFHIRENDRLSEHCHYSKNLWNEANYYIRQEFFKTGKWIRYNELDKYFNRNSENYKLLNSKVAQQTLKSLNEAWSSTYEAIKEKKINPDKFKGKINLPSYKEKDGKYILTGFKVLIEPEAYTSKCSFLDNETIEHHKEYLGKRISRGLFRSSNGTIINADVNGALNIIRKAIPDAFAKGIEGVGLHPLRVNYLKTNSYNLLR